MYLKLNKIFREQLSRFWTNNLNSEFQQSYITGTLMQIWKSPYRLVFIWK